MTFDFHMILEFFLAISYFHVTENCKIASKVQKAFENEVSTKLQKRSWVIRFSFEVVSLTQNYNCLWQKWTDNTLCKLRKLSKLKRGYLKERRRRTELSLRLSQNVNLKVVKAETEEDCSRRNKKFFVPKSWQRWNSMLRSLSFHEY